MVSEVKKISTKELLESTMLGNDYCYDIYFRMAVIDSYLNNDFSIWNMYLELQKKRMSQIKEIPMNMMYHEKEFTQLINNIRDNGFDKKQPIIVNKDNIIIDGAHRMACCLYFNIKEVYIIQDKKFGDFVPSEYTREWFRKNNLDNHILLADIQKENVRRNYYV